MFGSDNVGGIYTCIMLGLGYLRGAANDGEVSSPSCSNSPPSFGADIRMKPGSSMCFYQMEISTRIRPTQLHKKSDH